MQTIVQAKEPRMLIPRELYGVIGWPLGQTLSPLLQNTGFATLGIPAVYMAWPIPPQNLTTFLDSMRLLNIRGCSVTIPHKLAVMSQLDSLSEAAALAGAVNTLFWREDNLCGDNTDVTGFLAPLEQINLASIDTLLLGAGGAAHAAAAGLRLSGCQNVRVASPGNQRQYSLAERFAFTPIRWDERYIHPARLVINATPMGMTGALVNESAYDFAKAPAVNGGWAYDLVYNPLHTRFLTEAARVGRSIITGLDMFFGQGNAQFRIWTGRSLPAEASIALENALGANE